LPRLPPWPQANERLSLEGRRRWGRWDYSVRERGTGVIAIRTNREPRKRISCSECHQDLHQLTSGIDSLSLPQHVSSCVFCHTSSVFLFLFLFLSPFLSFPFSPTLFSVVCCPLSGAVPASLSHSRKCPTYNLKATAVTVVLPRRCCRCPTRILSMEAACRDVPQPGDLLAKRDVSE